MSQTIESYISFARKYRPQNFNELLGQEVLTKTLSYSILHDKLSQSILLTGIRGVGKTSSARIIAKTINCNNMTQNGHHIIPCENCNNCTSCNKMNHPDIIEMDAASKTSVDDIREIIESAEYKPLLGKYKLFIIDEVHMLSKNAFNALLKILEEPPEHVIFIFATTEVRKIPLTVLSRCQRYDLRRFTMDEVTKLLQNIANTENINITEEATHFIAMKSEGSARDAISLFEQAINYNSNDGILDIAIINKMLGVTDIHTTLKLIKLIIANNANDALILLDDIYVKANNLEYFLIHIIELIAELTKAKMINNYTNPIIANISQEITQILLGTNLSRLTILWQIFSNGMTEIKNSHNQHITMQMLIIKAIHASNLPKMEELMQIKTEQKIQDNNISSRATSIHDFLKFCHNQNELDIYYLLLNEVGIDNYGNNILEIACVNNIQKEILDKIKELLYKFSNKEWSINITKKEHITSLKDNMIDEAKRSEDYMKIKNKFPNSDISDILLSIN